MAYLTHDIWSMLNCGRAASKKPDMQIIFLHHVPLLILLPFYLLYEKGDFYIACMFLQAASSPLLHARYMLRKSSMNGSVTHKLCSVLLVVVCFLFRIALWPFLLMAHASATSMPVQDALKHLPLPCTTVSCAILLLNCHWWIKLVYRVVSSDLRARYDPAAVSLTTHKED